MLIGLADSEIPTIIATTTAWTSRLTRGPRTAPQARPCTAASMAVRKRRPTHHQEKKGSKVIQPLTIQ